MASNQNPNGGVIPSSSDDPGSPHRPTDLGPRPYEPYTTVVTVIPSRDGEKPHPFTVIPIKPVNEPDPNRSPMRFISEYYRPNMSTQQKGEYRYTRKKETEELEKLRAELESMPLEKQSKEQIQKYVELLQSELKVTYQVTQSLSDEVDNNGDNLEIVMNQKIQLEETNFDLNRKLYECKKLNKSLTRTMREQGGLVSKLKQAEITDARNSRFMEESQKEHAKLVKEYEILRHAFIRKDEDFYGFYTEHAELVRRLDLMEREKQRLQYQLHARDKVGVPSKYNTTKSTRSERSQSVFEMNLDKSNRGTFIEHQVMQPDRDSRPQPYEHSDASTVRETRNRPTWNTHVFDSSDGDEPRAVVENLQGDNTEPSSRSEQPHGKPVRVMPLEEGQDNDETPTVTNTVSPPGGISNRSQKNIGFMKKKSYTVQRRQDTSSEPMVSPRMPSELASVELGPVLYPTHTFRSRQKPWHEPTPRFLERVRPPSPLRYVRSTRTVSALGYSPNRHEVPEQEIYHSPLPRRSTTSFGRFHPTDYMHHNVANDYSPPRGSPIRRYYSPVGTAVPKMDFHHLLDDITRLKKERRYWEKEYQVHKATRNRRHSYSRTDYMSEKLDQLGRKIRAKQMQLERYQHHRY